MSISHDDIMILLAGDCPQARSEIARGLEDASLANVVEVPDGEAALAKLEEMANAGRSPDVIVTDMDMPRMGGLGLTKRIKQDCRLRHMPVIVFGLSSGDDRKKCKAAGADRELGKRELPRLVDAIEDVLASATLA